MRNCPGSDADRSAAAAEEPDDTRGGDRLRNHRSDGSALDAHLKGEDKQRIERNIDDSADSHGRHGLDRIALCRKIGIQPLREKDEQRADQVQPQIVASVGKGVLACTERIEHGVLEQIEQDAQHDGKDCQQYKRLIEDALGALPIPFPQLDRGQRGAAGSDQCSKCGENDDDRKRDPYARQRQRSDALHPPDIDAVNDVVQHVDQLRHHDGQRHTEHQPSYAARAQIVRSARRRNAARSGFLFHAPDSFTGRAKRRLREPPLP